MTESPGSLSRIVTPVGAASALPDSGVVWSPYLWHVPDTQRGDEQLVLAGHRKLQTSSLFNLSISTELSN